METGVGLRTIDLEDFLRVSLIISPAELLGAMLMMFFQVAGEC
jgi:hypothetical protein